MNDTDNDKLIQTLIDQAKKQKIGRRRFMEGTLAAGLGVAGGTALWTNKVAAQTPQRGGTFRVGIHDGNTSDTMDPGQYQAVSEIQLAHCHRAYLTAITNENGLGPDCATSWSASADASEWRFELNPNVTFHSGKKLTAADAIASLNHHRGEASTSAAKALLAGVTEIKADGDHAIVITLDSGNADLPFLVSDYHLVMLPANPDGTIDWQSQDGCGPYRIVNHEPGVRTEMVRHDDWHGEGAWFDAVNMIILNDANARQTALITGSIDAISAVDLKTVGLLQRAPGIEIDDVPSGAHCTLPMFVDTPPFDNPDVRMALKHALPREEIIEKILFGYGSMGNDHPIGPTLPYWADLEQRTYDPDKAKFHMERADLGNITVQLSSTDSILSGAVDQAVLYSEAARPAGINIEVVREPADGYWSNVWLVKPFVTVTWGARPTPDVMFTLAYQEGAAWNESRWANPRFNELLLLAKKELDEGLRAEMYREMQQLCRDDGGTIVPWFNNRTMARRSNVQHVGQIAGNWELDGARAYQRWWFTG